MDYSNWLFWNVDTQKDFVEPDGKLYVNGSEKLKPKWKQLTELAEKQSIRVINTADNHFYNSPELDSSPDFVKTFPEHCMAGTEGAEYVSETKPDEPLIFEWNKEYLITPEILDLEKYRNFVVLKDAFDVFSGNPWTRKILKMINPDTVVVYGVTTNVCVDYAIKGLYRKVKNIIVIEDAIKELPDIPLPFDNWKKKEVKLMQLRDFLKMIN